ncbi:L-seryl-tRNA(Sec) selenium transferase [Desnuesiella massiliensis]|uniref:L-seryl-tRNA(Sec) selenium transferase n=1 Tax=Desnuesiella massiliensis TaxID=1650662 RepID=UPI0006E12BBB|nr:L-seryl-tRNA(Sec) selenium transferase [Desnuesiella massiliensis]
MNKELLRRLPKMDELLDMDSVKKYLKDSPRKMVLESLRETLDYFRKSILEGAIEDFNNEDIANKFENIIELHNKSKLNRVINAAGIVIHTNLGRSILSEKAMKNVIEVAANYNNLEYDLEKGQRGSRYSHIEELIKEITGAEAALVVNNNAAAVMLVLNTLCENKEAIVSRGQLVEIGGSFRVPEVMKFSRATLVEVGTTNRTHVYDYENNIKENTGVLLKVHTSNFKIMGFTEEVSLEELAVLGKKYSIPVVEDIGSGVLIDLSKYGFIYEPTVQESLRKGADVVTFSGDKMLGGPQAGIIVGKKEYIDKIKKNQLTRALRIDKMTLAALEGTLKYYVDEEYAIKNIPTLNMMLMSKEDLKKKAFKLRKKLRSATENLLFNMAEDYSMVGGGSMPTEKMPTYVIKVKSDKLSEKQIEEMLRKNNVPIVARVYNGEVILDVRTILEEDMDIIAEAFKVIGENVI